MHTEKREDPLVELGYEVRDINKRGLFHALLAFFIFAGGSSIAGYIILRWMNPNAYVETKPINRVLPLPPNPLIQSNIDSKTDIMDLRQHEDQVLHGPVTWANPQHTRLRIPIDRAMEIIVERGLPKTGQSVPAISKGHTPNPEIGEKPDQQGIGTSPSTGMAGQPTAPPTAKAAPLSTQKPGGAN